MKKRGKAILIVGGVIIVVFVIICVNYFSKAKEPLDLLSLEKPYKETRDYAKLVKALGNRRNPPIYRQYAGEALANIEDPGVAKAVVKPLLQILRDKRYDEFARGRAALALGCIGDERAIEPLTEALTNDRVIWEDVIKALTLIEDVKDKRIANAILEMLADMDSHEKSLAIRGLNVDEPEVINVLIALVKNDPEARCNAIWALGNTMTKDEEAFHVLLEILEGNHMEGLDSSMRDLVMGKAMFALGKIGDKRAVEPLIKILEEDKGIRYIDAAIALGNLDDRRALGPLKKRMEEDKNEEWIMKDLNPAYRKLTKE